MDLGDSGTGSEEGRGFRHEVRLGGQSLLLISSVTLDDLPNFPCPPLLHLELSARRYGLHAPQRIQRCHKQPVTVVTWRVGGSAMNGDSM